MAESRQGDDQTQVRMSQESGKKLPGRYQASVVIVRGYAEGMEYLLSSSSAIIGRDSDATVSLKDPLVSRQHAEILFHNGAFLLRDLGSTNGTQMNNTTIKEAELRHGDTFRVGNTLLQFILIDTGRGKTYEIK